MTQLKMMVGALALAAMALAPLGAAHMDSTASTVAATLGLPSTASGGADRVSGVYYGSVSALADLTGVDPTTNEPVNLAFGTAFALCDMEVLSDGSAPGVGFDAATLQPGDEPEVDGAGNAPANGAANLGTLFNDGGVGGACHTHEGYYGESAFNTAGCAYAPAMGDDAVSPDIWLSTVCSYAHSTSGPGLATYFLDCTNEALTGPVTDVVTNCVQPTVDCLVNGACANLATTFECGPDAEGHADVQAAGESGWGSQGVAFPALSGTGGFPNPTTTPASECDASTDSAAVVFVWNAVVVDATALPALGNSGVSAATVGVVY